MKDSAILRFGRRVGKDHLRTAPKHIIVIVIDNSTLVQHLFLLSAARHEGMGADQVDLPGDSLGVLVGLAD